MIGIVVVSHSHALGRAAADLALEMAAGDARPAVEVAARLDATTLGTDAAAVAEAIGRVDSPDGVLVLLDLGSAVLSAEMALEFVDPPVAARVRLSPAPLVEGLVAAVVTAATGATLDEVAAEAAGGCAAKAAHLGELGADVGAGVEAGAGAVDAGAVTRTVTVTNEHGLHARPAALLVNALKGFDAQVTLRTADGQEGSAGSITGVSMLGVDQGDELTVTATGPDAHAALHALTTLLPTL